MIGNAKTNEDRDKGTDSSKNDVATWKKKKKRKTDKILF